MRRYLEPSLSRLGTDRVDLYYPHFPDPGCPSRTPWRRGRAGGGGPGWPPRPLERHRRPARRAPRGAPDRGRAGRVVALEPAAERELLPLARASARASWPGARSATASSPATSALAATTFATTPPRFQGENLPATATASPRCRRIAEDAGVTPAQLALAWLLAPRRRAPSRSPAAARRPHRREPRRRRRAARRGDAGAGRRGLGGRRGRGRNAALDGHVPAEPGAILYGRRARGGQRGGDAGEVRLRDRGRRLRPRQGHHRGVARDAAEGARGGGVAAEVDPYLNVDPGTMSPFQHGEVFVTDDGAETDLDLGHYERFTDESLSRISNVTTGARLRRGHQEGAPRRLPRRDGAGDPACHRRDQGGASARRRRARTPRSSSSRSAERWATSSRCRSSRPSASCATTSAASTSASST